MRRGKRPFTMGTANEAGRMEPNITEQEMRLDKVIILSFPDSTPKQETSITMSLNERCVLQKMEKTRSVGKER